MQIFNDFFEKIVSYTIFLDDYRTAHACMKRNYERLKMQGAALFQKKSSNLHMPGRTRPSIRREPALRGVPKIACNNRSSNAR